MRKRHGILAGGIWVLDWVKIIDRFPAQDTLVYIDSKTAGGGGAPHNVLVSLAKLKAPFPLEAVGLLGKDPDGRALIAFCEEHDIDTRQLQTTRAAATSYTDVMTTKETGRRTFFHHIGTNALIGRDHFDLTESSARMLHLGYPLLMSRMDKIHDDGQTEAAVLLKDARDAGFQTSLDLVSVDSEDFAAIVTPSLPHTDLLFLNEFEASRATGIPVESPVDLKVADEVTRRLFDLGVKELVVLHFSDGAFARTAAGDTFHQGRALLPNERIAGSVGAGDAFAAGVLYGRHEERPVPDCLKLGVCSAATSLTGPTSTSGVTSADEALALGEELGFHRL